MTPHDDNGEFDEPQEYDPEVRAMRAEIVRLEAQIDQLSARMREQAEETAELRARIEEVAADMAALEARLNRERRLRVWFEPVVWATVGTSVGFFVRGLLG